MFSCYYSNNKKKKNGKDGYIYKIVLGVTGVTVVR